jgi:hypothetical protein
MAEKSYVWFVGMWLGIRSANAVDEHQGRNQKLEVNMCSEKAFLVS